MVKIAVSIEGSFYLDNTGNVWVCGGEYLGTGTDYDDVYEPIRLKYFMDNGIKIKDIQCGCYHNLALSVDGNIYGWGENYDGQCGFDTDGHSVKEPTKVEFFDKYVVESIKAGWAHNWIRTQCGADYMFGYDECIEFEDNSTRKKPHRIDEIINTQCKVDCIIDIAIGCYNTQIICHR